MLRDLALVARLQPWFFPTVAFVLGACIGSFLNVVIYRVPAGKAIVHPGSTCGCGQPIAWYDNIPILSWIILRGHARCCGRPFSFRYPFVELLTGLVFLACWRQLPPAVALCGWVFLSALISATFIDLDHQLLPDSLTLPLLWLGLLASLMGWNAAGGNLPVDPANAISGAAAGYVSLWAIYHAFRLLTGKEGMGYGDFKLLGALGAWLGLQMLLPIVLLSALVGAIVGMGLIVLRRHERGTPIPFGPFLAAAGWLAMMWGPQMLARYLKLYAVGSG